MSKTTMRVEGTNYFVQAITTDVLHQYAGQDDCTVTLKNYIANDNLANNTDEVEDNSYLIYNNSISYTAAKVRNVYAYFHPLSNDEYKLSPDWGSDQLGTGYSLNLNYGYEPNENDKVLAGNFGNEYYDSNLLTTLSFKYRHGWNWSVVGVPTPGMLVDTETTYIYYTNYDRYMLRNMVSNSVSWANGKTRPKVTVVFSDYVQNQQLSVSYDSGTTSDLFGDIFREIRYSTGNNGFGCNDTYSLTVGKHNKPTLSGSIVDGQRGKCIKLTWNKIYTAKNGYTVYIDGKVAGATLTNEIELEDYVNEPHKYTVKVNDNTKLNIGNSYVYAYNKDPGTYGAYASQTELYAYSESDLSNSVTIYLMSKPTGFTVTKISYNQVLINWNDVAGAIKYNVKVDGVYKSDVAESEILLSNLSLGNHTISVNAVSGDTGIDDSGYSDNFSFSCTKLEAPVIELIGEKLYWNNYDTSVNAGANFMVYDIYGGETYYLNTVSTLYYTLDTATVRQEPGTHEFKVKAIALGSDGNELTQWTSNYSNTITVGVETLDAPVISFQEEESSIVTWTAIDHAIYYDVYVDDVKVNSTPVTTNHFDDLNSLYGDTPGYYAVKVKAMSNELNWEDSPKSNIIYYKVSKITAPTNVLINTATGILTWDASTAPYLTENDVITYDIYINDEYYNSTTNTSYQLVLMEDETYLVYLQARETTQDINHPNPRFIPSEFSNTDTYGILSKPINLVAEDDGYLRWDPVDNALTYTVMNSGEYLAQTTVSEFQIDVSEPRSYVFTVRTDGWGKLVQSSVSDALTVVIKQLNKPSLIISDNIISWSYIPDAEEYHIYINGIKVGSTTSNKYNLEDLLQGGKNEIYIVAHASSALIIDSEKSNTIYKSKEVTYAYYVKIKQGLYWSDPIDIEAPFTITEKYDDSLDTAVVTLAQSSRKEPYESFTEVQVCFNTEESGIPYKTYYFLISKDIVNERPRAGKSAYSHTLQLIERTRLLQSIVIPNMSITQPQSFVIEEWKYETGDPVRYLTNGNFIASGKLAVIAPPATQWWGWEGLGGYYIEGLRSSDIIGSIKSIYDKDETITLPIADGDLIKSYLKQDISGRITDYREDHITQRWYIRKHNTLRADQYNKYADTPEYEIASYNTTINNEIPVFKFSDSQYYNQNDSTEKWDIILEIDDIPSLAITKLGLTNAGFTFYAKERSSLKLMDKDGDFKHIDKIYGDTAVTYNPDTHYRIVFPCITVGKVGSSKAYSEETKYISDVLNKICNIANVLKTTEKSKYYIDPTILLRVQNTPAYQLKFEGKTMFECLETVGKEFLGIPYLVDDTNMISFKIVNEQITDELDSTNRELSTTESSIDNNSTGFICDAVNLISKDNYEVYPGNDLWTTPRSVDESSAYVTTTSCGIVLDKPIAYLKDIIVSNFDPNNPGRETSIIGYCYEKTFYNALSADNNGKGTAIYWQIGSNKIYGLGILEKYFDIGDETVNNIGQSLGLSPTHYAIQNIIRSRTSIEIDNSKVKDLKFKIKYVPYNNSMVKSEQFNTSGYQNYTYKVYNQSDGTISDTSFGAALNKEIQRLGNNSITKQYTYKSFIDCPHAGDSVLINGDVYYIDTVANTVKLNSVVSVVEYTKDYNKINPRIGINSEYRQYEIYNGDYTDRTLSINHYCYISTTNKFSYNDSNKTGIWGLILKDCLEGNPDKTLNHFYINVFDDNYKPLSYLDYDGNRQNINYGFAIHASRLSLRNSILFTGKMADNYCAGYFANKDNTYEGKYENKAVRYVDEFGRTPIIDIALGNPTKYQLYKSNESKADTLYPRCTKINGPGSSNIDYCVFSNKYYVNKDNREALTFSYQMHFKTNEDKFELHQGLTKYMFRNNDSSVSLGTPLIVGYKGIIKTKEFITYSSEDILGNAIAKYEGNTVYIDSKSFTSSRDYDGFAIVWKNTFDGNGEILLHCTMPTEKGKTYTTPKIYFNFKDELM